MKKLKIIYAITSVIFLIVLAVSPLKNYFDEWRGVQKNFNNFLNSYPQKIKPVEVGIKQIWVRDLNRIDRCTSCHLGISNSKLVNAPEPYSAHPKIYHDIDKFGCTICHQGQGLATNYSDAHQVSEFWDKPLLPRKYIESSCGRCHVGQELEDTPELNLGRKLIADFNCEGCHDIPGIKKTFVPTLDGIGKKVTGRSWIVYWLKNPSQVLSKAQMPNFLLSKEEINSLADFLMSFKTFPGNAQLDSLPEIYKRKKDDDDFIEQGKTTFREARCISCHAIEGRGGHLAPDLSKVASKANSTWIYNYISNPKKLQPAVEMPQYGFTTEEVASVTAYIESEFVDWDMPEDTVKYTRPPNFFEEGLSVFNKYNCGGCHKLTVKGLAENRGPELTTIGSKNIYQIEWGRSNIPHTVFNYIENKIKTPRLFGDRTRMPVFNFTRKQVDAVTTFLYSLQKKDLPINYYQIAEKKSSFFPKGKMGNIVKKYSCLKCHTIDGNGGSIAPDLSIVGSKLQSDWIRNYFKVPYSLRPIVEERMPKLFISDDEIQTIINYFNNVLLDDSLSIPVKVSTDKTNIERGKSLMTEKYGCQSCHIIGGKGGYVGPPLDNVGDRLKKEWIYNWILNPPKIIPETIEPRTGMPIEDALDITAYLMTLRKTK
jgi:mono/diheme cytochrome c family protein